MYKNSILLSAFIILITSLTIQAQSFKAFSIISGNPSNVTNEIRYITASSGAVGASIATTNGIPSGNNNLPYGAAFDPTVGKLYYSKPAGSGSSVLNVYDNTGVTATNANLATVSGGEYFRMGIGSDGFVYGTILSFVGNNSNGIAMYTIKLTRYNPISNVLTTLGNLECPSVYASAMPSPYNTGDYWSISATTGSPAYAFAIGNAGYGDLAVSPYNTMYVSIGKRLLTIPNYSTLSGTAKIPTVELGSVLPAGVGYNFGSGFGTYGISWDYNSNNLLVISSRSSDGRDGSYLLNPTTLALVGSFNIGPSASSNFADLAQIFSSIGAAKQLTNVQWLGYNNRYRLTYRIRLENIGQSIIKNAQVVENIQTAFPGLTISNVNRSFINNPASLVLNGSFNGTSNTNLLDGTKTVYNRLYIGANLNGGGGSITAGSNYTIIEIVCDVAGINTNGTTTYNNTAVASGSSFDGSSISDNSDNGTSVESGTPNDKANEAGEDDPTPIKFGSTISGTVWNDANGSSNNTFSNIFTAGESGTNATGLYAILIDPITNLVIASVPIAANGTYSFTNVPSFANLQVSLSTTAGVAGATPPVIGLPSGWTNTSPLITNTTGDINTGTYNAADLSRFGATDDNNNDFGIEQLPNSDPYSTVIPQPTINQFITLNGGANPPILSGIDPEDCNGGCTLANKSVIIDVIPANSELYYNGILVTNGQQINNFDPSLLQVKVTASTLGAVSTSFQYSFVDAAGKKDPTPATYELKWLISLPATGLKAVATLSGISTIVKWETLSEQNSNFFEVERSLDNINFTSIGSNIPAAGFSNSKKEYQQTDNISGLTQNAVIYYRVKLTDIDDNIKYSNVAIVRIGKTFGITAWPNPFTSYITVNISTGQNTNLNFRLVDMAGRTIMTQKQEVPRGVSQVSINQLENFASGVYLLYIIDNQTGKKTVLKFIKEK